MRAILSVSDKTGIVELAAELSLLGFEIISTGGTTKKLRQAEIAVQEVSEFTGFAEILGGRVKTLHPKIFGGILFDRENINQKSEIENLQIPPIDWVVVNLYPFEKISLEDRLSKEEMLEFIDIGGVSLLRAAAKNFPNVVALCDPSDYSGVLAEYKKNKMDSSIKPALDSDQGSGNDKSAVSIQTRKKLAAKAFAHTACYDSMIAKFFRETISPKSFLLGPLSQTTDNGLRTTDTIFPPELTIGLRKVSELRYGENPQQKAALYKEFGERDWGVPGAEKLQGKELSFNNYLDLDSAWQIVNCISSSPSSRHLSVGYKEDSQECKRGYETCCAIIKHTNPCGVAIGKSPLDAFQLAFQADSLSAFGGIAGFSSSVDAETAKEIIKNFFECVIAPEFEPQALEIFSKKPNLRVLKQKITLALPYELEIKKIAGGMIAQERDWEPESEWKVVSKRFPTPEESLSLSFAWKVCRFVKSNAIVLARPHLLRGGLQTCGIGAGQMSRIDSIRIAIRKCSEFGVQSNVIASEAKQSKNEITTLLSVARNDQLKAQPLVMASDAFFPFRDSVDEAAKAFISAIVQPGGSIRDAESIEAANQHNIAMVFTGVRHFKH